MSRSVHFMCNTKRHNTLWQLHMTSGFPHRRSSCCPASHPHSHATNHATNHATIERTKAATFVAPHSNPTQPSQHNAPHATNHATIERTQATKFVAPHSNLTQSSQHNLSPRLTLNTYSRHHTTGLTGFLVMLFGTASRHVLANCFSN